MGAHRHGRQSVTCYSPGKSNKDSVVGEEPIGRIVPQKPFEKRKQRGIDQFTQKVCFHS